MEIVAVRDSAIAAYNQPIFVPHVGLAVRSFGDEVNNTQSPMNAHPEDYELYHIGSFNTDTGQIASVGELRLLVRGKDVYKPRD